MGRVSITIFGVVAVTLGVFIFQQLRLPYRHFREHQSLELAREFSSNGDVANALLAIRQTLDYNPTNLDALILMSDMASDANSPDSLALSYRIASLSPTVSNKFQLAVTALKFERPPFPIATETLQQLQPTAATNIAFHMLSSQLALRSGHPEQALVHLKQAARLDPTNKLHQLNIAVLELISTDPSKVEAARSRLQEMVDDPMTGPPALRSLIGQSLGAKKLEAAKHESDELLAMPQAQFADRLQHLSVLQAMNSSETDEWFARIKTEASTNAVTAAQLLEWMLSRGESTNALRWLKSLPDAMQSGEALPSVAAEIYATMNDWDGLRKKLEKETWDKRLEFMRYAWLAKAFREQRQPEVSGIYWSNARSAAKRLEQNTALVQMVARWGWKTETEQVLQSIARRYPRQDWAWQELIRMKSARKDSEGLYEVYKSLLEQNPDSLLAKNNVAALGLLLKKDKKDCFKLAQEVYESNTNNPIFVSTEAFALQQQGRPDAGLRLMESLPSSALQRPEVALYYVVLLSSAGERNRAAPYLAAAAKGVVMPEEQALLDDARNGR